MKMLQAKRSVKANPNSCQAFHGSANNLQCTSWYTAINNAGTWSSGPITAGWGAKIVEVVKVDKQKRTQPTWSTSTRWGLNVSVIVLIRCFAKCACYSRVRNKSVPISSGDWRKRLSCNKSESGNGYARKRQDFIVPASVKGILHLTEKFDFIDSKVCDHLAWQPRMRTILVTPLVSSEVVADSEGIDRISVRICWLLNLKIVVRQSDKREWFMLHIWQRNVKGRGGLEVHEENINIATVNQLIFNTISEEASATETTQIAFEVSVD